MPLFIHLLILGLLLGSPATLPGAENKPASGELYRPRHPEVQAALKKAAPWLEQHINDPYGYGILNLLALFETRRCLGQAKPYLSEDLQGAIRSLAKGSFKIGQVGQSKDGYDNTYIAGLTAMILSGYVQDMGREKSTLKDECRTALAAIVKDLNRGLTKNNSWGYVSNDPKSMENHSTGQYAILALASAVKAGVEVPPKLIEDAMEGFLGSQSQAGGWGYTPTPVKKSKAYSKKKEKGVVPGAVYPTLTMTLAGISSLKVMESSLKEPQATQEAIQDALEWVIENLSFLKQQGGATNGYALYCLERAGVFLGQEKIGEVDWYDMGARLILPTQKDDGTFSMAQNTAFCALFLSKGSANLGNYVESVEELSIEDIQIRSLNEEWNRMGKGHEALAAFATNLSNKNQAVAWPVLKKITSNLPEDTHLLFEKLQSMFPDDSQALLTASDAGVDGDDWNLLELWMVHQAIPDSKEFPRIDRVIPDRMKGQAESLPQRLLAWLRSNPPTSRFTAAPTPEMTQEEWQELLDRAPLTASVALAQAPKGAPGIALLRNRLKSMNPKVPQPADQLLMHHLKGRNPFPKSKPLATEAGTKLWAALKAGGEAPPELSDSAAIRDVLESLPPALP